MKQYSPIDPNFTKAQDEIIKILKKYDMGASFFLASKKGTHFAHPWHLPSWSSISYERHENGDLGIRIRSKHENPGDHEKLEFTTNMIGFFADAMINAASQLRQLETMIGTKMHIDRKNSVGKDPDWSPS